MLGIQAKSKGGIFADHASFLSCYLVCEAPGKREDRRVDGALHGERWVTLERPTIY